MNQRVEVGEKVSNATIVIPEHLAVFRMDGNGCWHNQAGPFRHKRIIDQFNSAIDRDEMGYFITQEMGGVTEKVYFAHEGTALFVVKILWGDAVQIKLNTGRMEVLNPQYLYICEDLLYYRLGEENAKFNLHALLEISDNISRDNGRYYFTVGSKTTPLSEKRPDR